MFHWKLCHIIIPCIFCRSRPWCPDLCSHSVPCPTPDNDNDNDKYCDNDNDNNDNDIQSYESDLLMQHRLIRIICRHYWQIVDAAELSRCSDAATSWSWYTTQSEAFLLIVWRCSVATTSHKCNQVIFTQFFKMIGCFLNKLTFVSCTKLPHNPVDRNAPAHNIQQHTH